MGDPLCVTAAGVGPGKGERAGGRSWKIRLNGTKARTGSEFRPYVAIEIELKEKESKMKMTMTSAWRGLLAGVFAV